MSRLLVNLASRRFVNSRPVVRAAIALWVLGALLLAANAWSYWGYFVGRGAAGDALGEVEEAIESERRTVARLEAELAGYDLASQNEVARFLNTKIAERTLTWSRLFDRLGELVPADVRLLSLNPSGGERRRRSERAAGEPLRVPLEIVGQTKSDEAMFVFVDALFEDPAFERPDLARESQLENTRLLRFDLTVDYLPGRAADPELAEAALSELEDAAAEPAIAVDGDDDDADEDTGDE